MSIINKNDIKTVEVEELSFLHVTRDNSQVHIENMIIQGNQG